MTEDIPEFDIEESSEGIPANNAVKENGKWREMTDTELKQKKITQKDGRTLSRRDW